MTDPFDPDPMPEGPATGDVLDDLTIPVASSDEGPGQLPPTEPPGAPTDSDPEVEPAAVMAASSAPIAEAAEIVTEGTPPEAPAAPIADAAALAESEAAAASRAATAAEVALVAATAAARADEVAAAARAAVPITEVDAPLPNPRRRALKAVGTMLVRGILLLALFVGGLVLGNTAFLRSDQNTSPSALLVDPATDGGEPPPVVQEFVVGPGLAGTRTRSGPSLQAEPHARLTGEFRALRHPDDHLGRHPGHPRRRSAFRDRGRDAGHARPRVRRSRSTSSS